MLLVETSTDVSESVIRQILNYVVHSLRSDFVRSRSLGKENVKRRKKLTSNERTANNQQEIVNNYEDNYKDNYKDNYGRRRPSTVENAIKRK